MKATFVLLPDLATQNAAMSAGWDLHLAHGTSVDVRKLPPHVSLKQPFDSPELSDLLAFMDRFAASIHKLDVEFGETDVWPWPSASDPVSGVLTLKVKETPVLRALHTRLNDELAHVFGERPAAFDGDGYEFHMTLTAGGPSLDSYKEIEKTLSDVPDRCRLDAIGLFVYDKSEGSGEWAYTTYRIIPLAE